MTDTFIHRLSAQIFHLWPRAILLFGILFYRSVLSPLLGPSCRYLPSCSRYAEEAVRSHGPWRGSFLALRRLLRCHPLGSFGYDPVPSREEH